MTNWYLLGNKITTELTNNRENVVISRIASSVAEKARELDQVTEEELIAVIEEHKEHVFAMYNYRVISSKSYCALSEALEEMVELVKAEF